MKHHFGKRRVLIPVSIVLTLIISLLAEQVFFGPEFTKVSPRRGPIVEAVYALGTVKSDRVYDLKLGIMDSVGKLYVREGDSVHGGAPLLLTGSGILFRAPYAGTITGVYFHESEAILPSTAVISLVNLNTLFVQVALDQDSALLVKPGQAANLTFETIRGNVITGKVSSIYPGDGQFLVRIDVTGMPEAVLPEMTADVAIEVARRENALLIPLAAIQRGSIRLLRDGKSMRTDVKVGAIDSNWAEVEDDSVRESDVILIPEVSTKKDSE